MRPARRCKRRTGWARLAIALLAGLIALAGCGSKHKADTADGRIQSVSSIVNPDKLAHLGPVADLASLMGPGTSEER